MVIGINYCDLWIKQEIFSSRKCISKCCLQNSSHFDLACMCYTILINTAQTRPSPMHIQPLQTSVSIKKSRTPPKTMVYPIPLTLEMLWFCIKHSEYCSPQHPHNTALHTSPCSPVAIVTSASAPNLKLKYQLDLQRLSHERYLALQHSTWYGIKNLFFNQPVISFLNINVLHPVLNLCENFFAKEIGIRNPSGTDTKLFLEN